MNVVRSTKDRLEVCHIRDSSTDLAAYGKICIIIDGPENNAQFLNATGGV